MGALSDDRATVEQLLAAAGITPSASEMDAFVAMYPVLREQAERLYRIDLGDRP